MPIANTDEDDLIVSDSCETEGEVCFRSWHCIVCTCRERQVFHNRCSSIVIIVVATWTVFIDTAICEVFFIECDERIRSVQHFCCQSSVFIQSESINSIVSISFWIFTWQDVVIVQCSEIWSIFILVIFPYHFS